jgi:hypothetical protein
VSHLKLYVLAALLSFSSIPSVSGAATIRENFLTLRKIFNPQGRTVSEATVRVSSSDPRIMVNQYLRNRYNGKIASMRFFWNSDRLMVNDLSAGTIRAQSTQNVVGEWVLLRHRRNAEYSSVARQVQQIVNDLLKSGAVIGFDGADVNGCFGVTPLILILDRSNREVFAVELSTCKP